MFRVLRVSGTMRKAGEEAVRRARREIVRVKDGEGVTVNNLLAGIQDGNDDTAGEGNKRQGTQEEQLANQSIDSLGLDDSSDDNEHAETRRKNPRARSRNS